MSVKQLSEFIAQSFDDERLSRNESSVFRQLLEESQPSTHERALLRNEIFDTAEKVIRHPRSREVLEWVADLVKVMDTANAPAATAINEALFFPGEDNLFRLINLLKDARNTLDICVFTITDNRISKAITDAHRRGVKVRVITDDDKASDRGSDVFRLSDDGVPVAVDNEPDHMHHKFAIVDNSLLINGSFNWTRSASTRNFENIAITNQPDLIRAFSGEFEKLWSQFRGGA